jgi:hypothetical protein
MAVVAGGSHEALKESGVVNRRLFGVPLNSHAEGHAVDIDSLNDPVVTSSAHRQTRGHLVQRLVMVTLH